MNGGRHGTNGVGRGTLTLWTGPPRRGRKEQAMSEYIIRLRGQDGPQMVFISMLNSVEHAARRAKFLMNVCGFAHAEIWNERRLVLEL
jgi:hypothetical protein